MWGADEQPPARGGRVGGALSASAGPGEGHPPWCPSPEPLRGPRLLIDPVQEVVYHSSALVQHHPTVVADLDGLGPDGLLERVGGGAVRVYGCVLIAFERSRYGGVGLWKRSSLAATCCISSSVPAWCV